MALFNLARMTVSSTGTGTITLNAAVSGFLTFTQAGCSTAAAGQFVSYAINDTTQSEIGRGTYISSALTLTRGSSYSTNGNAAIDMSNTAQVFITPRAADLNGQFNLVFASSTQTFTTPANSTPTTVYKYYAIAGGGGAGGTNQAGAASGGGGQGGYSFGTFTGVSAGTAITLTVGAGGAGATGISGSNGAAGSSTTIGAPVNVGCNGGSGSLQSNIINTGAPGASGGTASGGTVNVTGQSGGNGNGTAVQGGDGGGDGGRGGATAVTGAGGPATIYGGGGGGAVGIGGDGSSGKGGYVTIEYILSPTP